MKIKKIKKISSTKYKIDFFDAESIITYDKIILENNILLKKEIDIDTYMKMQYQNGYYDLYSKAVKYIVTKLRSESEMRLYIQKYTMEKEFVDRLIEQLKVEGLINDDRYLKAYIADKVNLTDWGPMKIIQELDKLQVDDEKAIKIIDSYDEDIFYQKLHKIISKKIKVNKNKSGFYLKQKLANDLFLLGYKKDMIDKCLEELSFDETNGLEKEYHKMYMKLSKKYEGSELMYQIRQRLYQKGFSIDKINSFIQENFE